MRTHKIGFGAEITNLSSKYSPYLKLYVVLTLTLCMPGNFACFFCRLQIFLKLTFSKKYFRNTIRVLNSLDADQAQHFAGPDLGPNCLQRLSADDKSRH